MKKTFLALALCLIAQPAFAMTYSSIALSPNTGALGRGNDLPSQSEADAKAMGYCRANSRQPDDCRVVTWSRGVYCAAVAVEVHADGGVTWGSASGVTVDVARSGAYEACGKQAGHACQKILADVCSH